MREGLLHQLHSSTYRLNFYWLCLRYCSKSDCRAKLRRRLYRSHLLEIIKCGNPSNVEAILTSLGVIFQDLELERCAWNPVAVRTEVDKLVNSILSQVILKDVFVNLIEALESCRAQQVILTILTTLFGGS